MLDYRVIRANSIWEICEKILFSNKERPGRYSKIIAGDVSIDSIETINHSGEYQIYRIKLSAYLGDEIDEDKIHKYYEDVIFPLARQMGYYISPFYENYYSDIDKTDYIYFVKRPSVTDTDLHAIGIRVTYDEYFDKESYERKNGYFIRIVVYDRESSVLASAILSTIGIRTTPYKVIL